MNRYKGKKIAILGFGYEGRNVVDFLLRHGSNDITVMDEKTLEPKIPKKYSRITFQLGPINHAYLPKFDMVFKSPGIPKHKMFDKLNRLGKLHSRTSLFFDNCKAKIIGVTGTKGKTTTASLIEVLLRSELESGKVFLTGNIGKLDPLALLSKVTKRDWVIFELSSFQLEYLKTSPHIAVVLAVTADHLDYHLTERAYIKAKKNIVEYQKPSDYVIAFDRTVSKKIARSSVAKKIFVGALGTSCDVRVGEEGIIVGKEVYPVVGLKLLGEHNRYNLAAALAVCHAIIPKPEANRLRRVYTKFRPVEYRLELVDVVEGVEFYNDGSSTIPDPTLAAVHSLKPKPVLLMLGGRSKGLNYSGFIEQLEKQTHIKKIIMFGELAKLLKKEVKESKLRPRYCKKMQDALTYAKKIAISGDAILFSPAATSFDEYDNYKQRAAHFNQLIRK